MSKPGLFAGGVVADVPGYSDVKWPSLRFTAIWSCKSALVYCHDVLHTKREPAPQENEFHSGRILRALPVLCCRFAAGAPVCPMMFVFSVAGVPACPLVWFALLLELSVLPSVTSAGP